MSDSEQGVRITKLFHAKSERLGMELKAGKAGLNRRLCTLNLPESEVTTIGYFSADADNPVLIIRPVDGEWLESDAATVAREKLDKRCRNGVHALIVTSDGLPPPPWLKDIGEQSGVCIYQSDLTYSLLFERMLHRVSRKLLENVTVHGVLMSIMNVGVLITGPSGIGKSEVALDLINRGHRLVADDAVQLYCSSSFKLRGYCSDVIRGYLEVRGLGILDIADMFGNTAVQDSRAVDLSVNLTADRIAFDKDMDRLTPKVSLFTKLGISIPEIQLLVAPGRNLAVLVEAAVRTHIQHQFGRDPVKEFIDRQRQLIERRNKVLQRG